MVTVDCDKANAVSECAGVLCEQWCGHGFGGTGKMGLLKVELPTRCRKGNRYLNNDP